MSGNTITVSGINFHNCARALYFGGPASFVSFSNFFNNTNGIVVVGGNNSIQNCNFSYHSENAIFSSAEFTRINSSNFFFNSIVTGSGASISSIYSTLFVENSIFANNTGESAGAVFLNSYSQANFKNVEFIYNSASSYCGAVRTDTHLPVTFEFCKFIGNTAAGDAGAVGTISGGGNLFLSSCYFSQNYARGGGGVYAYSNMHVTIFNCTFFDNSASGFGGAVMVFGASANISYSNFIENININEYSQGGGIYNQDGTVDIYNSELIGNAAQRGGGLCSSRGIHKFYNLTCKSNIAYGAGGCIDSFDNCSFEIHSSSFSGNTARVGGAFTIEGQSQVTFQDVEISNNIATENGGAIMLHASTIRMFNSYVLSNSAPSLGAGISLSDNGILLYFFILLLFVYI